MLTQALQELIEDDRNLLSALAAVWISRFGWSCRIRTGIGSSLLRHLQKSWRGSQQISSFNRIEFKFQATW